MIFAIFGISPMELAIVAGVALLLFGGSRLPSAMNSLGRSVVEFKKGIRDKGDDEALPPRPDDRQET